MENSVTNKLKKLKRQERFLIGGEILSCIAPFVFLIIFNFDKYFVQTEAWRATLSLITLAGATIIALVSIIKNAIKLNLVSALTGLIVADVVCFFLGNLITDLAYILLAIIVGFIIAVLIEIKRKKDAENISILEEGLRKAKVDIVNEAAKKEIVEANIGGIL